MVEVVKISHGPKKLGRPSEYTEELAILICDSLSEGKSLRKVCSSTKLPSKTTVLRWLGAVDENGDYKYPTFRDQYARATTERADAFAEEINELADEAIKQIKKLPHDSKKSNAVVQAYKLKADNLKWNASRMKPKKYGERINLATEDDEPENPYEGLDEDTLRKLAQQESK